MTWVFREAGTLKCPAYDWDVVNWGGLIKIMYTNVSRGRSLTSCVLTPDGRLARPEDVAHFRTGDMVPVESGKTYVLTGDPMPWPDHPQLSLLRPRAPEPRSWLDRLLRRGPRCP